MSVMFITRPLFVLIGHVWHIAVPLATLTLDRELRTQWPAHLLLPAIVWMLNNRDVKIKL